MFSLELDNRLVFLERNVKDEIYFIQVRKAEIYNFPATKEKERPNIGF